MTCSSPTHDAVIVFGNGTFCGACFKAGVDCGIKNKEMFLEMEKEMRALAEKYK